jgi:hypothetical protein
LRSLLYNKQDKSKCGNVNARVERRRCKLPRKTRRFNVVRLDTKSSLRPRRPTTKASLTHRVSSDHRVALATKAPGNQRLSATKSPRQGRRHRLSRSPRLDPSSSSELLHQEGVSGPRTNAVPLHTKSEGPPAISKVCLPQQDYDTQGCSLKN